jgi:PAS domain S-box-containing protein
MRDLGWLRGAFGRRVRLGLGPRPGLLLGAALVVLGLLGAFAYVVVGSQAQSRRDAEKSFAAEARITAQLTASLFTSSASPAQAQASKAFGGPTPDRAALAALVKDSHLAYALILGGEGRILAASAGTPTAVRQRVAALPAHVRAALAGRPWLSGVLPSAAGMGHVIEFALPFEAAGGRRVELEGVNASVLSRFLGGYLSQPGGSQARAGFVVDGQNRLVAATGRGGRVGARLPRPLRVVGGGRYRSGGVDRYLVSAPVQGSGWRVLLSEPTSSLFPALAGSRAWILFVVLAAFGLAGLASLVFLRGVLAGNERLVEANRFFTLSLDLLCIADLEGRFRRLNPAFEQTLGYRSDELLARPFLDFVHPDDQAATLEAVGTLAAGVEVTGFENRYRCRDGSYKWILWKAIAAPEDGLIFAAARDISERKRHEQLLAELNTELEKRNRELAAANRELVETNATLEQRVAERTADAEQRATELARSNAELEQFASVASHDLQEPLRKIRMYCERLPRRLDPDLPAEAASDMERIQNAAARMQRLIDDLLAFARVGSRERAFELVDLGEVTSEVLGDLEARVAELGARIEVGQLPVVAADRAQISQLLQNLVSNALKFHRDDVAPLVRIRGEVVAAQPARFNGEQALGARAVISVEDNGIGFEQKYAERVFSAFERLQSRSDYEGTGIGLSIARKIAWRHQGEITATSTPGQGSTFALTLPLPSDNAPAASNGNGTTAPSGNGAPAAKGDA